MKLSAKWGIIAVIVCMILAGTVCYANDDSKIEVVVDNHDVVAESIAAAIKANKYDAKVTEIYSVNNSITNCYYRPLASEVPYLEETVLKAGFVSAYTGFFDLDYTDVRVPDEYNERYIQVLGSDILVYDESWGKEGYMKGLIAATPTRSQAIMAVYKALGLYQYHITYEFKKASLKNSPAILNLPDFISGVDDSYGRTEVFVTRSCVSDYMDKAGRDLRTAHGSGRDGITGGEFIVLCYRMMDYYGEPRMPDLEMAAVLQAYGSKVPTYLSAVEKEAYLYLAARGCLNVNIDYSRELQTSDMLEILMCVADEGSRTDYKNIQLVQNVNETLQVKGYYPRSVTLADNSNAVEIKKQYKYTDATAYDYYVEKSNYTTFKTKGFIGEDVSHQTFMPSKPGDPASLAKDGFEYLGVEKGSDGSSYFHYRIQIIDRNDPYMQQTALLKGSNAMWIQVNTPDETDYPANIWFMQGGGVYSYQSINDSNEVTLSRRAFKEGEFEDAVDAERKSTPTASIKSPVSSFMAKAVSWVTGDKTVVHAAMDNSGLLKSAEVLVEVLNANNITNNSLQTIMSSSAVNGVSWSDENNGTLKFTTSYYSYVISLILTEQGNADALHGVPAICDLSGEGCLISFKDLAQMGVLYYNSDGTTPRPVTNSVSEEILVLDSLYGRLVLNDSQHLIVVGSVIYQITSGDPLWTYNGEELYVDFRCAYGWSENLCSMEITGDQNDVTLNVVRVDASNQYKETLDTVGIKVPDTFGGNKSYGYGLTVAERALGTAANMNSGHLFYLASSNYALSNWIIYEGMSGDFLVVYYLKDAFTSKGMNPLDDSNIESVANEIGMCPVAGDNWCVRIVSLNKAVNYTPGQFSYVYPYGYIYNVPNDSEFSMDKYLSGEILLPLVNRTSSLSSALLYNMNVNYFAGYPYGTLPKSVSKGSEGSAAYVDEWGSDAGQLTQSRPNLEIVAAPAGIQTMYGGYDLESITSSTGGETVLNSAVGSGAFISSQVEQAGTQVYFGTMRMEISTSDSAKSFKGTFYVNNEESNAVEVNLSADRVYYNVAAWRNLTINADGSVAVAADAQKVYRYVTFGRCSVQVEDSEDVTKHETDTVSSSIIQSIIEADKEDDAYKDFDGFKFMEMLDYLDQSTSWIVVFCLRVLPYVGIILLTILFGLACMSSNRMVQNFFARTIDPVKLLTIGKMDVTMLDRKKAFIGMIIGYIAFAMLLDGNFLRVIIWLSSGFSAVAKLLRQL